MLVLEKLEMKLAVSLKLINNKKVLHLRNVLIIGLVLGLFGDTKLRVAWN